MTQQPHSWVYTYEKNENINLKRSMHHSIPSSTNYNNQDMETNQVCINRWLD